MILHEPSLPFANRVFFDNMASNILPSLRHPHIGLLTNYYKGVPAIICGSGPSLGKNLTALRNVYEKFTGNGPAVIFCCDSAWPVLNFYDFFPNFIVTCDPQEHTFTYLTDCFTAHYPDIIYDISICKKTFDLISKNVGIAISSLDTTFAPLYRCFEGRGMVHGWGSVANIALGCAAYMGCNPIYFVGMDLSFKEDATHSALCVSNAVASSVKNKHIEFDMHGDQVYTTSEFKAYRQMLVSQAQKLYDQCGIECYNATGGGILAGIPQVSCEEVALKIVEKTRRKSASSTKLVMDRFREEHHPSITLDSIYDLNKYVENLAKLATNIVKQQLHPITVGLAIEKLENLTLVDKRAVLDFAQKYALEKIDGLVTTLKMLNGKEKSNAITTNP